MIDKQFDNILKRKLNNMTDASNSDWSTFEHILDDAKLSGGKAEVDFDSTIKQKLAGISAANLSSDWSTFEHMLDEDQLTDEALDGKVSKEMNNMRAPYRQDHWELLHNTLEYQKQRNNSIVGYKVIELSLLLILLLSANNLHKYLPSTFEVEKPFIYATLDEDNQNDVKEPITESALTKDALSEASETFNNLSPEVIFSDPEMTTAPDAVEYVNSATSSQSLVQSNNKAKAIATSFNSSLMETSSIVESSDLLTYASNSDKRIDLIHLPTISSLEMSNVSPQKLDLRASLEKAEGLPIKISLVSKIENSIFIYAGLDNNLVNSPFDDIYDTEGFRTYGIGYSAGVEYGIKKDNKEFTLGIGYSNRAYEPRIIEELTGNPALTLYETSLDHIEFDIMSLSAGLKYMLLETDNWGVDLGIGASANIVVSSDYSIETRTIRDGKFVSSRDGRLPYSDLDDKPLHDGIFESGSLKENIYFTTDISIGLHRQLSEKSTFILRPEYSLHSFSDGIGPNNDLINNLSLNLGVRYSL